MSLLTAFDHQLLQSWNFYLDYPAYQPLFLQFARVTYKSMANHGMYPPQPAQLERMFRSSLLASQAFANYMNAKKSHMLSGIWPAFALAVVRFVIDNEWQNIIRP
jgi:hypothetical protein